MNKLYKTYLPVFNGFYNTDIGSLLDIDYYTFCDDNPNIDPHQVEKEYDSFLNTIDYEQAKIDLSKQLVDILNNVIKENKLDLKGINKFKFVSVYSPQYYNYSNDSINIEANINIELLNKHYQTSIKPSVGFKEYLKDNFTPSDGFIPFYDNSILSDDWNVINDDNIGIIIDFIFKQLLSLDDLYYLIEYFNVYSYATLYPTK